MSLHSNGFGQLEICGYKKNPKRELGSRKLMLI